MIKFNNLIIYISSILLAVENDNKDIVQLLLSRAKRIESNIFKGCKKIQEFRIPITYYLSIKSIENNAFALCTSLKYIRIPSSVTSIGNGAFDGFFH